MEQSLIDEYVRLRPEETTEMNLERRRVFFLVLKQSGNVDEATTMANININIKYLKCTYPPHLTEQLSRYTSAQ